MPLKRPRVLSSNPSPGSKIDNTNQASSFPSGRGASGGSALSARIDNPDRMTGEPPLKVTSGGPSSSPDVNASQIMQNMIMNDDDKVWYAKLFKKMSKRFLKPRNTVQHGFDVGLNAGLARLLPVIEGQDHRTNTYGVFIPVPDQIVRQLEVLYPKMSERMDVDDSPPHVTALYVGELDDRQADGLRAVVADVLESIQPFEVNMCGTSHFDNPDACVFHVQVKSVGLTNLHHLLRAAIENAGIPVAHSYGYNNNDAIYRGHITLGYQPPGQRETDIPVKGSWVVDRVEVWNMGSPVSIKLGGTRCLGCAVGLCRTHITEAKRRKKSGKENKIHDDELLIEPDDLDSRKKKPKKKEVNAVAGGSVSGNTLPLGMSNKNKREQHKRAKISARAFGNGKVVG